MKLDFEKISDWTLDALVWEFLASVPFFIVSGIVYLFGNNELSFRLVMIGIGIMMFGLVVMILGMLLYQASDQLAERRIRNKK